MLIFKCDRCGLIVEDRHEMEAISWSPCIRSDVFIDAFDAKGTPRYGDREVCPQCFSLFKSWMGVESDSVEADIEPFEVE